MSISTWLRNIFRGNTIGETNDYALEEVFTPASYATVTYVARLEQQRSLVHALKTTGEQIVLFGPSGVGKSTLLMHTLSEAGSAQDSVTTRCLGRMTFDDVLLDAFDQLAPFYSTGESRERAATGGGSLGAKYVEIKGEISQRTQQDFARVLPPQLTPNALADLLGEAGLAWILEDFHKLPLPERSHLADVMKAFMDASARHRRLKIVAIGATDTARQIIQLNSEMVDRVNEIRVPGMSRDELQSIVTKGTSALNIAMDAETQEKVLACADESAAACHRICLNMCRIAGIERTVHGDGINLTNDHYAEALKNIASGKDDSLKERFDQATSVRRKRLFENGRLLVEALVSLGGRASHNELLTQIRLVEPDYRPGNVTLYTASLQEDDHGAILKYDEASRVYSFADELVREYAFSHFDRSLPRTQQRS